MTDTTGRIFSTSTKGHDMRQRRLRERQLKGGPLDGETRSWRPGMRLTTGVQHPATLDIEVAHYDNDGNYLRPDEPTSSTEDQPTGRMVLVDSASKQQVQDGADDE